MTAKMYAAAQRRLRLLRASFDTGTFSPNPSYVDKDGNPVSDAGAQFSLTRGTTSAPDPAGDAVAIFQKHSLYEPTVKFGGTNVAVNASIFLYSTSQNVSSAHATAILAECNIIGGGLEGFGEAFKARSVMQPHLTSDNVFRTAVSETPRIAALPRGQVQPIVAESAAGYAVRETTPGSGVYHMYPALPQRMWSAELSMIHYSGDPAKTAIPVTTGTEPLYAPLLLGNGQIAYDPDIFAHAVAPYYNNPTAAASIVPSSRIHAFAMVNPFSSVAGNYGFLVPRYLDNSMPNLPVRYAAFASGARTEVGLDFTDAIHSVAGIVLPNNDGMKGILSGTPYRMVWMNSAGNIDLGEAGHHINFPGAQKITGGMETSTILNRGPVFQGTSPTTLVTAVAGGGGSITGFEAYNTADGLNAAVLQFLALAGEVRFSAFPTGSAGNPYMTFYTSSRESIRIADSIVTLNGGLTNAVALQVNNLTTTGVRPLQALQSNGTTKVNLGLDGSHFFALLNAAGTVANFTIDPATGNFVSLGSGVVTSTLDVTGITTINSLLNLNTLTTSATIRPMITIKESGVGKYSIGMDGADLFAIINQAGSAAIVTVDNSGNIIANEITVAGAAVSFNPGVTQSGALSAIAASGGHYRVFGKWCFLQIELTVTTATGAVANNGIQITGIPAAIAPKRTGNESYIGTFVWFRTGVGYFHAQAYAATATTIQGKADSGTVGVTAGPGGGAVMIANDKLMVVACYEIA